MRARSCLAVLCGCVAAVVAYSDDGFQFAYQDIKQNRLVPPEQSHWGSLPGHDQETWPGGRLPHHPPKFPDKTIYEVLRDDDRFSRVFKLVNFADDVAAALKDPASTVTFFAPPNRALGPPHRHEHHDKPPHRLSDFNDLGVEDFFTNDVIRNSNKPELFATLEGFVDSALLDGFDKDDHHDSDDEKERKKKILKKIVSAVLKYHIIGAQYHATDLAKNTTFPSSLVLGEGSMDNTELRIRVEQPKLIHPSLTLNFYARVIFADVETKNGIIHAINHPLFPPPSTFQILYSFFDIFSTLTSAMQHVNLTDAVDWHWVPDSKTLEGSPAVTLFAPTNRAFSRLPRKLKLFLFSPFGAKALRKILSYHVVPDYVFHSNWVHNATDDLLPEAAIQDDPLSWLQNTLCHEQEYNAFRIKTYQTEWSYDALLHDTIRKESHPEAEGDGYANAANAISHLRTPIRSFTVPSVRCPARLAHEHRPGGLFIPSSPDHVSCSPRPPQCECASRALTPHTPPHAHKPIFHPVYTVNATLPTLLGSSSNHTLHVRVAQFRSLLPHGFVTKVFVNGQWVVAPDVPTRNGAIHVVHRLIKPRGHGKHGHGGHGSAPEEHQWIRGPLDTTEDENEWEDWEEWLPQWANED